MIILICNVQTDIITQMFTKTIARLEYFEFVLYESEICCFSFWCFSKQISLPITACCLFVCLFVLLQRFNSKFADTIFPNLQHIWDNRICGM